MKNLKRKAGKKTGITLYGFGGFLIALNAILLPLSFNVNSTQLSRTEPAAQAETQADEAPKTPAKRVIYVTVTAYSSTPDQTDDTPFITANGTHVRDGIIAANFLAFGAKVRFPDYSGDKIYEVTDRMNARYPDRADIWFPTREAALRFGIRTLKMEIL